MPKAYAIRRQDPTRLSQKTALYLQSLQDIKEEHQVLDLIEPQYQYPVTSKVHTPVIYLGKDNKPYDFKKKATRATRRTRIDIAHCPPATLAYLINNFPEIRHHMSDPQETTDQPETSQLPYRQNQPIISSASSNAVPSPVGSHHSPLPPVMSRYQPGGGTGVQTPVTGQPNINTIQAGLQGLGLHTGTSAGPIPQTTIDPNVLGAIVAAIQMANQNQAQTKNAKVKIKEPETYNGKGRGGEADRFILACENYFRARSSDFPNDETRVQFALSYLTDTAQAWGDVILRDLLGAQNLAASVNWKRFKKEFLAA
ncbi:hypothetical protein FRC01_010772, partial [Tulasnella sp. 417]